MAGSTLWLSTPLTTVSWAYFSETVMEHFKRRSAMAIRASYMRTASWRVILTVMVYQTSRSSTGHQLQFSWEMAMAHCASVANRTSVGFRALLRRQAISMETENWTLLLPHTRAADSIS